MGVPLTLLIGKGVPVPKMGTSVTKLVIYSYI